jgi:hypothetical protein
MANNRQLDKGYMGEVPTKPSYDTMVIKGYAHRIHNVVVYEFTMGDVDDPDLYAAQPLWEWQQSEQGQWIMAHAIEPPMWHRHIDNLSYGHKYAVTAKLKGRDYTFWQVKWNKLTPQK